MGQDIESGQEVHGELSDKKEKNTGELRDQTMGELAAGSK